MGDPLADSLNLILGTLGGLFVGAILIRFLLQAARADFYNPVSQALVKLTSPALRPFRKIVPGYRGLDFASLIVALVINTILTCLMLLLAGYPPLAVGLMSIIGWSFIGLVSFILKIYFWGLLISIIASWIAPHSGHPILLLIYQMMEPIQSRFRRILPPLGGLDFSPIFILLGIRVLEIMLQGLARGMQLPPQFVIGI